LGLSDWEINFLYVTDSIIHRFNRRYLKHDHPTDVIAFEMKEKGVLGDVIVSIDTARRQAKEEGHGLFTELQILSIHGLLHILGYRDKREKDRDAMWRETDRLLNLAEKN